MTSALNYALVALVFAAWIGLFAVKDAARESAARAGDLARQITEEEARIETLMTDWAILNEPSYLQSLAQTHLGLDTTQARQIVTMRALPPIPLTDPQDPPTGTFFAAARGYRQLPSARAPRVDPYTEWAHPVLRPEQGR